MNVSNGAKVRKDFTPRALFALCEGRLSDPETVGLSIVASKRGEVVDRKWHYYRRLRMSDGRVKKILGEFPSMNIVDARAAARMLNRQIDEGRDPRQMRDSTTPEEMVFVPRRLIDAIREKVQNDPRVGARRVFGNKDAWIEHYEIGKDVIDELLDRSVGRTSRDVFLQI